MFVNKDRGTFVKKGAMEAVGVCDRSGFYFSKSDLVREYEWAGDELIWNGLLVGKPYLDEPDPQKRVPPIYDDPHPVEEPRPIYYEPPARDASPNPLRKMELAQVSFTKRDEPVKKPHNIAGPDGSKISSEERIKLLMQVNFNGNGG